MVGQSLGKVKNRLIATSTIEAEFVACFEGMKQAAWLKFFMIELNIIN